MVVTFLRVLAVFVRQGAFDVDGMDVVAFNHIRVVAVHSSDEMDDGGHHGHR
jgi:hypothetical protein